MKIGLKTILPSSSFYNNSFVEAIAWHFAFFLLHISMIVSIFMYANY